MAGMELPYWRSWAAETLSDSRFLSWDLAERGAFYTLLNVQWREGAIPGDQTSLAKLLHVDSGTMRSLWSAIGDRFVPHPDHPGMLANPRMEEEREDALRKKRQRKDAGKAGAESRWAKHRQTDSDRMANASGGDAALVRPDAKQSNGSESKAKQGAAAASPADAPSLVGEQTDRGRGAGGDPLPCRPAPPRDPVPPLTIVDEAGPSPRPTPTPGDVFRQRLADRLARTALHPVGGGATVLRALEDSLHGIPVDEAVEVCAQRVFEAVRDGRRQPGTLAYFVQVLADLGTERALAPPEEPEKPRAMFVPEAPAVEYEP